MSELELAFAFQLKSVKAPPWVVEHRFDAVRRWRFDFAWPDLLLAVECEGGTWTGGRHTTPQGFEADCEKYAEALLAGWRVLRVTKSMIEDGRALAWAERLLK